MKADQLLLELLFDKLHKNPRREDKPRKRDITLKDVIKVLKEIPEFHDDLDKALKALKKEEVKKGRLTLVQKYILWTVAAATVPPVYILVMGALFRAMTSH
jgi:hypothetical protein